MSFNITSSETLSSTLKITGPNLRKAKKKYDEDMPEISFLNELEDVESGEIAITDVDWSGCWSGHSYDVLKEILCDFCSGDAAIVYTWEDGSTSALKVSGEGKSRRITEPTVKITLED